MKAGFFLLTLLLITPKLWSQKTVTTTSIEGTWKTLSLKIERSELMTEEVYYPEDLDYRIYTPNEHWVFHKDSLSKVDYPCSMFSKGKYSIKADFLTVSPENANGYPADVYSAEFHGDTLVLSTLMIGSTYYLVRDTLPKKQLDRLLKGKINVECLYGHWEIPVGEVSVPFDAIVVSYPWTMPDTLTISASNLHWYWAKNRFYLEVDGKKRPFRVERASLTEDNLNLIPEKWVEEYIKKHDLEPYQVEHVWMRKIEEE